jgi:hypothetical protein
MTNPFFSTHGQISAKLETLIAPHPVAADLTQPSKSFFIFKLFIYLFYFKIKILK